MGARERLTIGAAGGRGSETVQYFDIIATLASTPTFRSRNEHVFASANAIHPMVVNHPFKRKIILIFY